MKTTELSNTPVKGFSLTLHDGKAVVRQQNRINGLIGVRQDRIPPQYHNILAQATFSGNSVNENITWTTDVFDHEPQRLGELVGTQHAKYLDILQSAFQAYANAFSDAKESVRKLIKAAITYSDESKVYCGDDRVVITEWGMTPKGRSSLFGLPIAIEDTPSHKFKINDSGNYDDPEDDLEEVSDNHQNDTPKDIEYGDQNGTPEDVDQGNQIDTPEDGDQGNNDDTREAADQGNNGESASDESSDGTTGNNGTIVNDNSGDNSDSGNHDSGNINGGNNGGEKEKNYWRWIIPLLLLLLILLACVYFKCCASNKDVIEPVTPGIDSTDVVLSNDSLRYVVNNRLLLLVTNKEKSLEDFAEAFYKKYNKKDFIISNPDTIINRVTLTLPSEARDSIEECLPTEFEEFGLIIIPESMYRNSYRASDPAFDDEKKRWYFDECSVFDAWDVTMGSDEIIVAIIDDGFDLNHPELKGKIVKPYNAVLHNDNVMPSPSGHGTHVAATAIGNADNNSGISGIAPKCKLMPIQVGDAQGNMTSSAILDAVVYAIGNGADVVNMSLGMAFGPFVQFAPIHIQKNFRDNMFLQEEKVWRYLFNIADANDVTFVLAGGNENCLIGLDPMQRSEKVIKVSAVRPNLEKADFSNYGDMSTVSAPGVRIYNAIPGNKYTYMDGTSMAAPIVTGGCALLKSKEPSLTTAQLVQMLQSTGKTSPSDVGPVVNFANALKNGTCDAPDCEDVNKRYQELLAELEQLKREHPGCIQHPDTLALPKDLTLDQLVGRWKSTSTLKNDEEEDVVIYFTFNGTSTARLDIIEQSGSNFFAPLSVNITNDKVYIDQPEHAVSKSSSRRYSPYKFILKPGLDRKADGNAKNKMEAANVFDFNLINI